MKKKITKLIPMMIFASFFVFVSTAAAFEGPSHEKFDKEARHERMKQVMEETMQELGITEEQRKEIKEQKQDRREKAKELREKSREKREELKQELDKYDGDPGKVDRLIDEITDLKKAQLRNRVEGIQSIKKVLTKEQFEELTEKLEARKETAKERFKGRRKKHKRF